MGIVKYKDKVRLKNKAQAWMDFKEERLIKKLEGLGDLTELRYLLLGCWYFFDQLTFIQPAFLRTSVKIPGVIKKGVEKMGLRVKDNGMMGGMQVYRWMCKVLGGYDELLGFNHRYEEKKDE